MSKKLDTTAASLGGERVSMASGRDAPLKIAFFCVRFPVISEAFIASSAAALIDRGHDVHIYALDGKPPGFAERQPQVNSHRLEERLYCPAIVGPMAARVAGAPAAISALLGKQGAQALKALDPRIFGRSVVYLRSLYQAGMFDPSAHYDILHCQFGHLAHGVLKLRKAGFVSGKVVVQFRGYDITEIPAENGPGYYDNVFRNADYFIANSDFFRDRAIALGAPPAKMSVSYSGIDLANFPFRPPIPWAPGQPLRLMTVGRLVEKKGVAFALDAVAQLKAEGVEAVFDIVGDGPLREQLGAATRRLGLEAEVRFHGARGHAYIRPLLDQAHLFLAPSVTGSDTNADAPINTLKEAMATGVPIVSTWHGGIPELVDDGVSGFLAEEGSGIALGRRIADALRLSAKWPQIADAARIKVTDKFGLGRTTDSLLGIYEEVLKS